MVFHRLFHKLFPKTTAQPAPSPPTQAGEDPGLDPGQVLAQHFDVFPEAPSCPDCDSSTWERGEEKGICLNVRCTTCGSEFNLAVAGTHVFHAIRIGKTL